MFDKNLSEFWKQITRMTMNKQVSVLYNSLLIINIRYLKL